MNETACREILKDFITLDDTLDSYMKEDTVPYVCWFKGLDTVTLDGEFTAAQLAAIAWWMENKS